MKKLIIILSLLYLLFPIVLHSEDEPTMCPMDMSQFPQDTIPNYLQPWWNNIQIGKFAVVYVDFPDGRYINGSDTLQAFYDWQLEWVRDHGVLDAAGEMGIVLEQTNIQSGFIASKSDYFDLLS